MNSALLLESALIASQGASRNGAGTALSPRFVSSTVYYGEEQSPRPQRRRNCSATVVTKDAHGWTRILIFLSVFIRVHPWLNNSCYGVSRAGTSRPNDRLLATAAGPVDMQATGSGSPLGRGKSAEETLWHLHPSPRPCH